MNRTIAEREKFEVRRFFLIQAYGVVPKPEYRADNELTFARDERDNILDFETIEEALEYGEKRFRKDETIMSAKKTLTVGL